MKTNSAVQIPSVRVTHFLRDIGRNGFAFAFAIGANPFVCVR